MRSFVINQDDIIKDKQHLAYPIGKIIIIAFDVLHDGVGNFRIEPFYDFSQLR